MNLNLNKENRKVLPDEQNPTLFLLENLNKENRKMYPVFSDALTSAIMNLNKENRKNGKIISGVYELYKNESQ